MASVTQTDILNATLRELGAKRITSIDENIPRAKVLKDIYHIMRREMFQDGRYKFCTTRSSLTLKGTTPDFGYLYEFELPANFLTDVKEENDYIYEVENDGILSDESALNLIYIFDNEDVSTWSPSFVKAFYLNMALAACYEITGSTTKEKMLKTKYDEAVLIAMGGNSRQGNKTKVVTANTLINVRR